MIAKITLKNGWNFVATPAQGDAWPLYPWLESPTLSALLATLPALGVTHVRGKVRGLKKAALAAGLGVAPAKKQSGRGTHPRIFFERLRQAGGMRLMTGINAQATAALERGIVMHRTRARAVESALLLAFPESQKKIENTY
jgi:hypothetical protein